MEDQMSLKIELDMLRGVEAVGTTLISFFVPGGSPTGPFTQKLTFEEGTASRIKSKSTRHAVVQALKMIRSKLQLFAPCAPENGLAIFAGECGEDGKSISVCLSDLPQRIRAPLYRCDTHFHIGVIEEMLRHHHTYGFIVFDGSGCLIAAVGANVQKLCWHQAFLPKKHSNGGQSAKRFAHLRLEQRAMFATASEELTRKYLIDPKTSLPWVKGLIVAGSSNFKNELVERLDGRLKAILLDVITVQYGATNGLNEAIRKSESILEGLSVRVERQVLQQLYNCIDRDNDMWCIGLKDTCQALEMGAVKTLVVSEQNAISLCRVRVEGSEGGRRKTFLCHRRDLDDRLKGYVGEDATQVEVESLVEVADTDIQTVSDATPEGKQFCVGFGGLGALLSYSRKHFMNDDLNDVDDDDHDSFGDDTQIMDEEDDEENFM